LGTYIFEGISYTSTVPVPYVDADGFHMPEFADVLAARKADLRGVYGQDVNLDADTQDSEIVGIDCAAIMDCYNVSLAVYNSFSPDTAVGVGLSTVVKINNLRRKLSSQSTVDLTITGQANTVITDGVVKDSSGNSWLLPPQVIIPFSGQTVVTATCSTQGAVTAAIGDVNDIYTVTKGWQAATNQAVPAQGLPVEDDSSLRRRQAKSTALAAQAPLVSAVAALEELGGVVRVAAYENDSDLIDSNNQPGHTVCFVIDGGDNQDVGVTITQKKIPGTGTYGTSYATVVDPAGIPHDVRWFRPIEPLITVAITVKPKLGYTPDAGEAIKAAVVEYVNSLDIGENVSLGAIYGPALLAGTVYSKFFTIQATAISRDGAPTEPTDVPIAFNEAAFTDSDHVIIGLQTS
jgi:uncharacterized phage protein gp47/JayE